LNLDITPNPASCAGIPGGVNSVVSDHAKGFIAAGYELANSKKALHIVHAIAQHEQTDVFHCHGLYPIGDGYFDKSYSHANDIVLQNALRAKVTICISDFSANILRHKLHIDPTVTRNGIWTKDYKRGGSKSGPVIFAKAALDANAKADDVLWLKNNSNFDLLSIAQIHGVKSTGKMSRDKFIETLKKCSVYLGTTKENCSMATMEAMVMGVPVVGYNNGFNSEWLQNGIGCELVTPGDKFALKEALTKVKSNWQKYSNAARSFAEIFDWHPVINQLLGIYENVSRAPTNKKVSIVIPCHNYQRWIGEAIESALSQTIKCEVIVVDDCSTDNSREIARRYPVKLICNANNIGVAETRNAGIRAARGEYIICLDADDRLHPDFAERHLSAFRDNQDAITYAPIDLIDESGAPRKQKMFTAPAMPALHATGRNQIPSCCMFRKTFWQRAGGYDKRYTPAEDAHLWLKIFILGGQAQRVTTEPLMDYRVHGNSLSAKGFSDWWKDTPDFSEPIQERDPNVTIEIDEQAHDKQGILWSLENQNYQQWNVLLKNPGELQKTFPWINQSEPPQLKSRILLKAPPSPDFLEQYASQTPEWIDWYPVK